MKILLVHNYYKQRGGEDVSFDSEGQMLLNHGHDVRFYTRHNDDIDSLSKTKVALQTTWNRQSFNDIKYILNEFKPDVIHCTNLFPLISPSAYDAAREFNVPVVQSLRNYRPVCINSLLFREGEVCEKCVAKTIAWPGIANRCYRNSRIGSMVVAAANGFHKMRGTWRNKVDLFFTPTEFTRRKYVDFGFPAHKIAVKPNFLFDDLGISSESRKYALFVGRLSPEKGVETLLSAWNHLGIDLPLKIAGGGKLAKVVRQASIENRSIDYLGELAHETVTQLIGEAKFLIMPSEWYETFGRTLMESFSRGTPVIASRMGAMNELVEDGFNGLSFEPGDADQLKELALRLANNESYRQELGINRERHFSRNTLSKRIIAC